MMTKDISRFTTLILLTTCIAIHGYSPLNKPRYQPPSPRRPVLSEQLQPSTAITENSRSAHHPDHPWFKELSKYSIVAASLAVVLSTTEPALAVTPTIQPRVSTTAARIHLNSLPPSTISVHIEDLPVIGGLLSGTYSRVVPLDNEGSTMTVPVTIRSPIDKVAAVANIASAGHLEFDVDGILNTHLDVDVAVSKPGVATVKVDSPLIPLLPFHNAASDLVPPAARALKLAKKQPASGDVSTTSSSMSTSTSSSTSSSSISKKSTIAAQVSVNSLPPSAIYVEIQDLPVLGKALSGVYTKLDDSIATLPDTPASITIESPKDKVGAIKAIASAGHFEFEIEGVLNTHVDVDVATDSAGSATIRVASPIIPALPFQNSASY